MYAWYTTCKCVRSKRSLLKLNFYQKSFFCMNLKFRLEAVVFSFGLNTVFKKYSTFYC